MNGYFRSGLTGGTATDLDGISDASLSGGEVAWVYESETLYQYIFDETSTDVEANPTRIRPDDYDTGVWHLVSLYNSQLPVMASGVEAQGGISGLNLSLDTDTEHDVNCSIGSCKDSTNQVDMVLSTTITKRIDAAWVEGDDNGGLLNGGAVAVAANTVYHVYLIKDSSGTVDMAFLLDGDTLATRLSGISYTYARWLGFVTTDSSSDIATFYMSGDIVSFPRVTAWEVMTNVTNASFNVIDLSSYLPESRISAASFTAEDQSISIGDSSDNVFSVCNSTVANPSGLIAYSDGTLYAKGNNDATGDIYLQSVLLKR